MLQVRIDDLFLSSFVSISSADKQDAEKWLIKQFFLFLFHKHGVLV